MVQITYVDHAGAAREVDAPEGTSVMQAAVSNGIPGIDAICGGCCSCATCHVFVDEAWFERVGPPSPAEQDLLDFKPDLGPTSRLSCQIPVTAALEGLVVRTPERQE